MSESIHVVCGTCNSVVRVPYHRLADAPRCPKCHANLIAEQPIELRAVGFEQQLTRSDLPLVVDFWAPWCGPCRAMAPHFAAIARRMSTQACFAKVNSDDEPELSSRFAIRSIPTLIVFRGGKEIARQSGAMDSGTLERWVLSVLGTKPAR